MLQKIALFALFVSPVVTFAQAQDNSLAWKRWKHLQHGVAVSGWFSESGNYSIQQLRAYTTPADIEHIKQLGFDHIRIPIDPVIFQCDRSWDTCEQIAFLDQVVQKAVSLDLAVIIDFHPNPQYTHQLVGNGYAAEGYFRLWTKIANHYGKMDPDHVMLEVMNEVSAPELFTWFGLLQEAIRVIRLHAPNSTLLVQGANYSDIQDLIRLPKLSDPNLIYDFHYYEPHIFTHQGATWGLEWWTDLHDLTFPPTEKSIAEAIAREDDPMVRYRLHQFFEDYRDPNRVARDIKFAADWAKERNVPLICDEFGAYRNFSKPEDRERWITTVRSAFEANHIGWTAWDYQGGFGVVYKENNALRDDDVSLRALGLRK